MIFKDDRDSASGRGCRMFAAHFQPYTLEILRASVQAFALREDVSVVRVTEGHRHIRDTKDQHEACKAFDFTAENGRGERLLKMHYDLVGSQIRKWLGADYDVIVHGEGTNLHIHVEHDPKPQRGTA